MTPPTHTIATVDMLVTVTLENLPNDCLMISELSTYTITCIEYNTHSENLIVKSVVLKGYNHEHKLRSNSEKNRVKLFSVLLYSRKGVSLLSNIYKSRHTLTPARTSLLFLRFDDKVNILNHRDLVRTKSYLS